MAAVKVQKIPFGGWDSCVQVSNGIVDLIITADVGPRIIRYGLAGQENELCEIASTMGVTGGNEWRMYGGHRLWHSPEDRDRTYEPDNFPVPWEQIPGGIKTIQNTEQRTGLKKEMEITLSPVGSGVKILHRLINEGIQPVELAVWSISVMAGGGMEIIPQAGKDTGLLPNRVMALWPYTKLNDPRIFHGDRYIVLRHDPAMKQPVKFGTSNENGWAAYFNRNHLFIKYYTHENNARYPDFGMSYETYAIDFMIEMETLSPLTLLKQGGRAEHTENWALFDNIPMPPLDEAQIDRALVNKLSGPSF